MAQEYEQDELDFSQSGGGWWIRLVGIGVYIAIILAYAWQTLQLVGWLFPDNNLFMQVVTVFVCDGCATGYAMAEMFYRFRLRKSKHFVYGMWIVTFIFSTLATIIQMYLSSTHNIPHSINSGVIATAYGVIIAAFVANILAITIIIRMEYNASQPVHRYMDDKPKKKYPQRVVMDSPLLDNQPGVYPTKLTTSPLAAAPLDTNTQASQMSSNGHSK